MVFQHFNLWSHMTVLENVMEAPIQVLGLSKQEARERAVKYLAKVGIDERQQMKYPVHLPAVSSSVSPLPARWRWSRKCCCLMNRPPRLILNWWAKCCASCSKLAEEGKPWWW
jgi:histidine transport system ATP-binding protein